MPLDGLDAVGGCADLGGCLSIPTPPSDKPGCILACVIGVVMGLGLIAHDHYKQSQQVPVPAIRTTPQPAPAPKPDPSIAPVQTESRWKRLRNRAGDWMLRQGEEYIEDKLKERRERRERDEQGK